ncbi:MAG: metalloregulator ArsR/SmtB family transcription factor [Pseudomonadota bacterium]
MKIDRAVKALGALAQDTRLRVFRLLIEAGQDGMAAGDIARRLDVPPNTLSAHLQVLTNAGLAYSERDSRRMIYRIEFEALRELLSFLVEDCCKGRTEVCAPLIDALALGDCNAGTRAAK